MLFKSGFSLKDEESLFEEYINSSEYSVCGFSYGAIKAFKYVKEQLNHGKRIDTLQLFSPAFFQNKSKKFKKLQIIAYTKDKDKYLINFIDLCFYPHSKKDTQHYETDVCELEELLNYEWNLQELKSLSNRGVKIEVYLGGNDKIIDVESAREFFLHVATVTYIKNANHFLQIR
ncbi:MAG: pimelyl-ACP methyl ester esterase BioV [Sulfurimonas sp.]|uniref:pimelyl-ACP methyl ester esterase BioV n=1 Tax=Sulfurimonas sp. TaxID=2022749 RepID=UPI00260C32E6|nr:pimelyl-ACP methyl ester esterase BioV [Sulfurimonas sp.]MCW8895073.1 pimelyl-ACP methyl ester esterase BioV [Sulfurimonas sp.]MCW8954356.1 pimelyl-ACP methyl ester esterase BioV [Sulfurimonas sp.]MCW9067131.1 pimelyl-ACP methyl ester esterase BioV [Sulfurimonas sp.]